MSYTINISSDLFHRLERHATGFSETPESVIEKLIDAYEGVTNQTATRIFPMNHRAEIVFPDGYTEESFKAELIKKKKAYVKLFYINDKIEIKTWHVSRFNESSNLIRNLRSGQLRNSRSKGILKAEVFF